MTVKHATRILLISLVVAWLFDQLFWQKPIGVNFFIFVALCLLAGALITREEGEKPAGASLLIVPVVLYFATVTFLRQEPFTLALSVMLVLGALMVLVITWLGGKWLNYSLSDYFMGVIHLMGSALARPVSILSGSAKPAVTAAEPAAAAPEGETAPAETTAAPGASRTQAHAWYGACCAGCCWRCRWWRCWLPCWRRRTRFSRGSWSSS